MNHLNESWNRFLCRVRYFFSLPAASQSPLRCIWRVLFWRVCCLMGITGRIHIKSWNLDVWLPPVWRGAGTTQFFIIRELYEPELAFLPKLLKPGQTFVDAGANIGLYTLAGASVVGPSGKVLSFEPEQKALAALQRNIKNNRLQQVEVCGFALSDAEGEARLFGGNERSVSASLGADNGADLSCQVVQTVRLDRFLAERNINRVDVIKMDVEGAEALILKGAGQTLANCHPIIIFEVNEPATCAFGLPAMAAWELLASLGYGFFELSEEGQLKPAEKNTRIRNIIALPPEKTDLAV